QPRKGLLSYTEQLEAFHLNSWLRNGVITAFIDRRSRFGIPRTGQAEGGARWPKPSEHTRVFRVRTEHSLRESRRTEARRRVAGSSAAGRSGRHEPNRSR